MTCVSATDEADSVCRDISAAHVRMASVGRGHHFSGEYGELLDLILQQITPASVKGRPVAAQTAPSLRSRTIGREPATDPFLRRPDLADFIPLKRDWPTVKQRLGLK